MSNVLLKQIFAGVIVIPIEGLAGTRPTRPSFHMTATIEFVKATESGCLRRPINPIIFLQKTSYNPIIFGQKVCGHPAEYISVVGVIPHGMIMA